MRRAIDGAGDNRGESEDDVAEADGVAGEVGEENRIGPWSRGWLAWMKVFIDLIQAGIDPKSGLKRSLYQAS